MSKENVHAFYRHLDRSASVREEALRLGESHPDQEARLDAFLLLARREGYPFTLEEFLTVMYEKASEAGEDSHE